jgi:phage gp16-like protein
MTGANTRKRTLARIHAAAKADGIEGADYKAKLKKRTGKESCADMDATELADVAAATRPTDKQRGLIWWLCKEIGLEGGTEGAAFKTWVRRVLKTDDPDRALRYLTRTQAKRLITGLLSWRANEAKKAKQGTLPPALGPETQAPPDPATR